MQKAGSHWVIFLLISISLLPSQLTAAGTKAQFQPEGTITYVNGDAAMQCRALHAGAAIVAGGIDNQQRHGPIFRLVVLNIDQVPFNFTEENIRVVDDKGRAIKVIKAEETLAAAHKRAKTKEMWARIGAASSELGSINAGHTDFEGSYGKPGDMNSFSGSGYDAASAAQSHTEADTEARTFIRRGQMQSSRIIAEAENLAFTRSTVQQHKVEKTFVILEPLPKDSQEIEFDIVLGVEHAHFKYKVQQG